jgi:uncharacterized membrane protein YdjX (TVP38/TMEM64 family)
MLEWLETILNNYPVLAPLIFIIARIIPIVIPPIPGLLVDIIGIAVFGWWYGFILAEIAVILASMISFFVARKFREPLLGKFLSLKKLHEIEDKITEKQKFIGLISLRLVFFDLVNYAAGLTKMRAQTFFWNTLVITLPLSFITYYFGEKILNTQTVIVVIAITIIIFLISLKKS